MTNHAQLIILCEDLQQWVFAYHYFVARGFHPKKIRRNMNPKGKGSGEQYVREQYPKEVHEYRAYRNRSGRSDSVVLAVVVDADMLLVKERKEQLAQALIDKMQLPRQDGERIALFVPKRNIETWIHYLQGQMVEEEKAYSKLSHESNCKDDVIRLAREICPQGLPDDAPPSLHKACIELARIFP